jgi:hypothetical protein
VHAISIELDLVQPVEAVRCLLYERRELRFNEGRQRRSLNPSAGRGYGRVNGFWHRGHVSEYPSRNEAPLSHDGRNKRYETSADWREERDGELC